MLEATNTPTTARADRYVQAATTIPVTFNQPGPTARSKPRIVTGLLLGTMHTRGQVHHYRVAGDDGVLYLAPPTWVTPECRVELQLAEPVIANKQAQILTLVREMARLLDARDAQRANVPACQVVPVGWMNLPDSHPMFKDPQHPEGVA